LEPFVHNSTSPSVCVLLLSNAATKIINSKMISEWEGRGHLIFDFFRHHSKMLVVLLLSNIKIGNDLYILRVATTQLATSLMQLMQGVCKRIIFM
jgi:hypothetical protein